MLHQIKTGRMKLLVSLFAAAVVLFASAFVAASVGHNPAAVSSPIAHGSVVGDAPRVDFPQILDGKVFAIDQVGDRVIVGGTFTTLRLDDGMLIKQPNVAAFYVDSGTFDASFRPQVDGRVQAIASGPGNSVFLGGKFSTVDGGTNAKLVRYDLDTMAVDPKFHADADAVIRDIEYADGRLFVGGQFAHIGDVPRNRLAELHPATGAVQPFAVGVTGEGSVVRELDLTPDGSTLVVVHGGSTVGGEPREGAALIDVSSTSPEVLPWRTDLSPTDGAFSPDGSVLVVVGHAEAAALPVGARVSSAAGAAAVVAPNWVTELTDTVQSVAVSDVAVYVGGHFCLPSTSAAGCDTNMRQLAALDPATGEELPWDLAPGETPPTARDGVRTLAVTDRGLFAGHGGDLLGDRETGRGVIFDLRAPRDTDAPETTHLRPEGDDPETDGPEADVIEVDQVTLSGRTADSTGVASVALSLRDRTTDRWLRNDGSWGARQSLDVVSDGTGVKVLDWSLDVVLPDGSYEMTVGAADFAGNRQVPVIRRFSVATFADTTPPSVEAISLTSGTIVPPNVPLIVAGMAKDDVGVERVVVTIRDRGNGQFLQRDGSWATFAPLNGVHFEPDTASSWSFDRSLPAGDYELRVVAKDAARNPSVAQHVVFAVEAAPKSVPG